MEISNLVKICNMCHTEKSVSEFSPTSKYKGELRWRGECKVCNSGLQRKPAAKRAQKKYRVTDKYKETRADYRAQPEVKERELLLERLRYANKPEHRQKRIDNSKKWIYAKLESDPVFRNIFYLKNRLREWVKANGAQKNSFIGNYVGCTKAEFKLHIEKQFQPGMTWENHGKWHLDHILPISLASNMEEAYALTHFENFQPLWALDNLRKSNKVS